MKKPDFHAEFIEACVYASGLAYMCGYSEAARAIAQYATCDKKTLTTGGKGDTIKTTARQGEKQEGKTMTIYGRAITNEDMRNIAGYMDDEIREELHGKLAPCSNEKFLREYIKRDPEILEILRNEFDFSE
jgi:hypothetical protein